MKRPSPELSRLEFPTPAQLSEQLVAPSVDRCGNCSASRSLVGKKRVVRFTSQIGKWPIEPQD